MNTYWERLFNTWAQYYYTGVLWTIFASVALIVVIKNFRKDGVSYLFIIYLVMTLILSDPIFGLLTINFKQGSLNNLKLIEGLNILFASIELSVFLIYFKHYFNKKNWGKIFLTILIVFALVASFSIWLVLFSYSTKVEILRLSFYINFFEFFILTPFCFFFFYQLLGQQVTEVTFLTKSPAFWITTGLFFYLIISLPLLIIGDNLLSYYEDLYDIAGSVHYISFSFLLISIIKAFTCKVRLTL